VAKGAYLAHDRFASQTRMYFQMVFIGLVIGAFIYAGIMNLVLSRITAPIPELIDGAYAIHAKSPNLPVRSLLKYYVSFNPRNYFNFKWNKFKWYKNRVPDEVVEPELRALLGGRDRVSRDLYVKTVFYVSQGKVEELRRIIPTSLIFFPVFGILYFVLFSWINRRNEKTKFVRGTSLLKFDALRKKLNKAIRKEKTETPLRLGEVLLPDSVSRRHMLVLGTSGTGKSVTLNRHIATLREKAGKCVIYDVKGEFCAKHFTGNDIIFYPFDQRSIAWSFFNEVKDYPDLDILCTSLFEPPKDSKDTYWYNAARDVFRTGLFYLYERNKKTNKHICDFFSEPLSKIHEKLSTLPVSERGALKHIDKHDSNQAASVISILQERIVFFRYLTDRDGTFSFRDYISQEDKFPGSLFLMNIRRYDAIFRPLMTFVVDVMIREVLSLTDSFNRRITFLIDEFGSLAKLPAVFDFLTMARSKGGFLVIANQDLGSVSSVYGQDQKETFFNNFNIHLTFRLNDPTTAEFISRAFGEREVIKFFESDAFSPTTVGNSVTLGEQEKLEKIILPTEFQSLPDFCTYLKIANYGTAYMETRREFMEAKTEEFIQRSFTIEEVIKRDRKITMSPVSAAAAMSTKKVA